MRVFGRILYAVIMVGFFLLAFTYSRDLMQTQYLNDVFGASLVDENSEYPKFYYFYTSIPNYHKNVPIISIDSNGYEIMGYEVLQASVNADNELELIESVYLIVYSDTEDLSQVDYLYLQDSETDNQTIVNLQRFKTLNIINGVNDQGTVYLPKELFLSEEFDTINLLDYSAEVLVSEDFQLSEADFTIKGFIETFFSENNRLPTIDDLDILQDNNIFPNKPHVADDYVHIFYIAMGIYFSVLIFMTYIIFFRKRKYQ